MIVDTTVLMTLDNDMRAAWAAAVGSQGSGSTVRAPFEGWVQRAGSAPWVQPVAAR